MSEKCNLTNFILVKNLSEFCFTETLGKVLPNDILFNFGNPDWLCDQIGSSQKLWSYITTLRFYLLLEYTNYSLHRSTRNYARCHLARPKSHRLVKQSLHWNLTVWWSRANFFMHCFIACFLDLKLSRKWIMSGIIAVDFFNLSKSSSCGVLVWLVQSDDPYLFYHCVIHVTHCNWYS